VLFSSVASLLGSPGQSNYSAANAALDAAAEACGASGLPVSSIQWGAWAGAGMAAAHSSTAARMQRMGLQLLQPDTACDALLACLHTFMQRPLAAPQCTSSHVQAVAHMQWSRLRPALAAALLPAAGLGPLLRDFDGEAGRATRASGPSGGQGGIQQPRARASLRSTADAATAPSNAASEAGAMLQTVAEAVHTLLGQTIAADSPLMSAGLDSLGAVELRNSLEARVGMPLPQTLVFDYPSVEALAGYLTALSPPPPDAPSSSAVVPATPHAAAVTRSMRLPCSIRAAAGIGATSSPARRLVCVECVVQRLPSAAACFTDPVGVVPHGRWDVDAQPATATAARFGSFLPGVESFDAQVRPAPASCLTSAIGW
jgi:acyl carrier protein